MLKALTLTAALLGADDAPQPPPESPPEPSRHAPPCLTGDPSVLSEGRAVGQLSAGC
jgi:hypothetical protein